MFTKILAIKHLMSLCRDTSTNFQIIYRISYEFYARILLCRVRTMCTKKIEEACPNIACVQKKCGWNMDPTKILEKISYNSSVLFGAIANKKYAFFNSKLWAIKVFSAKCGELHLQIFLHLIDFFRNSTQMPTLKHIQNYKHIHYLQLKHY